MDDIVSALFSAEPKLQATANYAGNHVKIQCPFHGGGDERTPSCSVSLEKPVFFCHGCHTSGHISYLMKHLGMAPALIKQVLKNAGMNRSGHTHPKGRSRIAVRLFENRYNPFRGRFVLDEDLLDDYRLAPKVLLRAGFEKATLRHFEVGFDKQNLRITFPIRNVFGELVGISGRTVVEGEEPKYRVYDRELHYRTDYCVPEDYTMESVKDSVLWHGHVIRPFFYHDQDESLVITEGFKACMWCWQSGYKTTAALMGSYLSEMHAELLFTSVGYAVLFLDNDDAGVLGTLDAGWKLLGKGINVRVAVYPDGCMQPDDLIPEEVQAAVSGAIPFYEWRSENGRRIHEAKADRTTKKHVQASQQQKAG